MLKMRVDIFNCLKELTALYSLGEQVKVHHLICAFFSVKDQVYFSTV